MQFEETRVQIVKITEMEHRFELKRTRKRCEGINNEHLATSLYTFGPKSTRYERGCRFRQDKYDGNEACPPMPLDPWRYATANKRGRGPHLRRLRAACQPNSQNQTRKQRTNHECLYNLKILFAKTKVLTTKIPPSLLCDATVVSLNITAQGECPEIAGTSLNEPRIRHIARNINTKFRTSLHILSTTHPIRSLSLRVPSIPPFTSRSLYSANQSSRQLHCFRASKILNICSRTLLHIQGSPPVSKPRHRSIIRLGLIPDCISIKVVTHEVSQICVPSRLSRLSRPRWLSPSR